MTENRRYSTEYFENYPHGHYVLILDTHNDNRRVFDLPFKHEDLAKEVCEMLNKLDAELESAKSHQWP